MCGIAGILYKHDTGEHAIGESLIQMLDGCQHRGRDSTGFALYGESLDQQLSLRFIVGTGAEGDKAIANINTVLTDNGAEVVGEEHLGNQYKVQVRFQGAIREFAYALEHAAKLLSMGSSLDIIKDVGDAHDVDEVYHVRDFKGSHGVGHVRLATESDVKPEAAHPFWATGFSDIAIVHNGQITNYWKMRRKLESKGYEFRTDNDSELIAVFLAEQLNRGIALEEVLEASIEELDGTFSFLVSTKEEIGFAKDNLAAKPMVMYEDDGMVAIASEEVSLNRLFPGRAIQTTEPLPGTFRTWSKST
jgi:glutamate synthase domain-containing protein 1